MRVDSQGNVYLLFSTTSGDIPTTAGAHDRTYSGNQDGYLARISADGARLLFGTYCGGSGTGGGCSTHNMALDSAGWPTLNAFQDSFAGGVGARVKCRGQAGRT